MNDQLSKKYDYQLQLITRRWQYFATYLITVGFLGSVISDVFIKQNNIPSSIPNLKSILLIFGIFIGFIFLQFISLTTKRVDKAEISIGKENSITNLVMDGKFYGLSETVLIYLLIYFINSIFLILLFGESQIIFFTFLFLHIVNLFFLNWRALKHIESNNAKIKNS